MQYPGTPIKRGDENDFVKAIQAKLGVHQRGLFGPTTEENVKKFQSEHGLEPDGIVGPKTWKALFNQEIVSDAVLHAVMPRLSVVKRRKYLPLLNAAMREFEIDTPKRAAAFLAQLAHESGQLRYFRELASGEAYEGRQDLGNTQPGDGRKYRGRGPIQVTGRHNYRKYGKILGIDLEKYPVKAEDPATGFRIAGAYWSTHGLNRYADQNTETSFVTITRRINGGINGLEDRQSYWRAAKRALAVD